MDEQKTKPPALIPANTKEHSLNERDMLSEVTTAQKVMTFISLNPTHYRLLLWEKFAECDYMEAMELMGKAYESGDQETADEMNLKIQEKKNNGEYDNQKTA